MNHSSDITQNEHEFLELVRRLEVNHYDFDVDPHGLTKTLQIRQDDTPMQRLVMRAQKLDESGQIRQALRDAHLHFNLTEYINIFIAVLVGFILTIILLSNSILNFFYFLMMLLSWHIISLILWLMRPKTSYNPTWSKKIIHFAIHKFMNKTDVLHKHAHEIIIQSKTEILDYHLSSIIHKNWLVIFLSNISALTSILLLKSHHIDWQSALINPTTLDQLIAVIGFIPSLLMQLPNTSQDNMAQQFVIFLIACITIYGLLPRLCAWLFCRHKIRNHSFGIDKNLYYYENLVRQLNRQISAEDSDITPINEPIQPITAKITDGKKLIATFAIEANDPYWYQLGAGNQNLVHFGVIDDKTDLERLNAIAHCYHAQIYLGIDCALLPNKDTIQKLLNIVKMAPFGIIVELLHQQDATHYSDWQKFLSKHNIAQRDSHHHSSVKNLFL